MESLLKIMLTFILLLWISGEINALRLTDVTIPRYADFRQSAQITCHFDLGGEKLYSIKWYKDEFEFFRYMPDNNPQIQTFPLAGINLDLSQSNMTLVTLHPLNFSSTGSYRCEVSTDGPSFETVVRNGNMTVMVYPEEDPLIEGIQQWYSVGDYITGNCTSSKSYPVAELSWYINNKKADSWLLEKYPVVTTEGPLYTKALGLRFKLEDRHFKPKDQLELKCLAVIADLPHWERRVVVRPARLNNGYNANKPAPDRYSNDGSAIGPNAVIAIITMTVLWLLPSKIMSSWL